MLFADFHNLSKPHARKKNWDSIII